MGRVSASDPRLDMYHHRFGPTDGLDDAFALTLAEHTGSLRAHARRLAGNAADADDLIQETLLRCWSARRRFESGTNFGAWSRTVMRNCFLSGHRRARFHADLPDEEFDRIAGPDGGQDLAVELSEIRRAFDLLSPDHRDAVLLSAKGVPIEQAAEQLAIPEGTFKSRVARGRVHLRELMNDPRAKPYRAPVPVEKVGEARRSRNWKGVMIG